LTNGNVGAFKTGTHPTSLIPAYSEEENIASALNAIPLPLFAFFELLLISLTPGVSGLREGIFFLTSDVLGISGEGIMQLALLDRGIMMLTLFFWFLALFWGEIGLDYYCPVVFSVKSL
jgi:hypothetical protein